MTYGDAPYLDADPDDPQWDNANKVHDWRNYVGHRTREFWSSMSPELRVAIARDAQELASAEEWD